ncbi:MAG: hypothetical protein FJ091_07380 [Deltaproteobacteria bacterium]|nr:hypothetical protein [Deltaproteobacteria bacterium]
MKKLLWLAIFIAAAYSVNEVRVKGIDGAFGGAFAGAGDPIDSGAAPMSIDADTVQE